MAKVAFTAARVGGFECPRDKKQDFLWDATAPGLGLRATPNGKPSYVFQSVFQGKDKFSELLQQSLLRYRNRAIETAQVIEELIEMAKKFQEAAERGDALGLNHDELAFYDALAMNEAAVRELRDDTLKKIAVELTLSLRKSVTVDWSKRETVRAKLRVMVKTLLKRYKYPPDRQEEATETVLKQAGAESLSAEWVA